MIKKFLGILVLVLLWSSFGNAGEYCFSLNESKKILDTRAESFTDLIFLYKELECLGKSKEAIIYKKEYNKSNEKFKIAYDITSKLGMLNETIWSLSWMILSGIKINKLDQSENLKFIHEKIDQSWLKDIDYPEVNYVLSTIYLELQNSVKSKLHLDNANKKLIEISKTIKNNEYKHSFLRARLPNEIVEAWEQKN